MFFFIESIFYSFKILSNLSFWKNGDQASDGLAQVAETGATQILETELKTMVSISNVISNVHVPFGCLIFEIILHSI